MSLKGYLCQSSIRHVLPSQQHIGSLTCAFNAILRPSFDSFLHSDCLKHCIKCFHRFTVAIAVRA